MTVKYQEGDKVRLITKEELEKENGLFTNRSGDVYITATGIHDCCLLTLTKNEFLDNQGVVFEIITEEVDRYGSLSYRLYNQSEDGDWIECVSPLAIRPATETVQEPRVTISSSGFGVNYIESPLEQARKIMEHAVESINDLGVTLEIADTLQLCLDSKEGIYISKNVFGQEGRK